MFLFPTSSISVLVKCFFIWFALNWLNNFQAEGQVPLKRTVTKARCVANCYTMYADRKNDSERICGTTACQECLSPCEKTFKNEAICINECTNSSSCEASCRFLKYLKTLSSDMIRNGDGSKPPIPGTPTLRNRTFTSITLQWKPVNTTNGTSVYLIAVEFEGDFFRASYFINAVLLVPRITIRTSSLCARVGSRFPRRSFNGIHYKYHVAVLTENSSISYGTRTTDNLIPLVPESVSNITINSIVYVANPPVRQFYKLKLTAAWKQPQEDDEQVISNYAVVFTEKCSFQSLPNIKITGGPSTSEILYISEKFKKCSKNLLSIYALNRCLVSAGTTLTFEYPGCANTTDFPKEECYKFDPPDSPPEDLIVLNATFGFSSINDDYTFNVTVAWEPPRYPYKEVFYYTYYWTKVLDLVTLSPLNIFPTQKSPVTVGPFEPNERYLIVIQPVYIGGPRALPVNYTIQTPDVDPVQVTVRNLTLAKFVFSPENETFDLHITWQRPSFNYSKISEYSFTCQVNGRAKITGRTRETYLDISGIVHGAPVTCNVTPIYIHRWVSGNTAQGKDTAPVPGIRDVIVRNLRLGEDRFIFFPQTGTFDLNVTWEKPLFNYSRVTSYVLKFRVHEGHEISAETNLTTFVVRGCNFGEPVQLTVTPKFMNRRIVRRQIGGRTSAPLPVASELKVRNLQASSSVENKEKNTYDVKYTWNSPLFKYRTVLYYSLSYEVSGSLRNQFPCTSSLKSKKCSISKVNDSFFQISGILPQEHISIEVTPVYNDRYIMGQPRKNELYNAPAPRGELLKVTELRQDEIVPTSTSSFRTTVRWQKPVFKYSNVSYYTYKIVKKNEKEIQRRAISFNTVNTTTETNVLIDGINLNEEIEFQVTPVFIAYSVVGIEASLSILKTTGPAKHPRKGMTVGEISGLTVGLLLLSVVLLMFIRCLWRERKIRKEKGLVFGKNGLIIDHWEIDGDLVTLEDEIGEGAFGKVYRGTLKEITNPSQTILLKLSKIASPTINSGETYVVAVKMLQDMSDSDQRKEFLDEIQLMKTVGSHRNIVNMIGCCTVVEPMFLLVEYVPYGDLLHYLRKHRGKVKESLGDELSGPYRSTYCETYFTDTNSTMKVRKDSHIYVNSPWMSKEDGAIELLSFNNSTEAEHEMQPGEENKALDSPEEDEKELKTNEDILTPGDLMAFAWQITQGMEYLSKKGFVHRDLAARNVLVGEKKIAKVADFGLTRHVYEDQVYQAKRNRKLPLKWMSIEAIFDQTFTAQSDVWAFGVVVWEIVTLGGTPYPTIDNRELLRLLKNGYRMEKPDTCNDELYQMMQDCWQENPENRPDFTTLRESLETMMQKDNPYLDLTAVDESRAYYNVPSFNSVTEESADDECDSDVEMFVLETTEKPKEGIRDQDLASIDQSQDYRDNDNENQQKESSCAKDSQDPLDVVINFNELERNIYRTAGQELAF